jgi:hypothetical protein
VVGLAKLKSAFPAFRTIIVAVAVVLGFLIGLATLGISVTPIMASLVVLIMMKKGGERREIAKSLKIIVIAAVILILLVGLFPPYWEGKLDAEGNLIGTFTKWDFNRHLKDLIESVTEGDPIEMIEYMPRHDVQRIEILVILAVAGAAYLITKKRHRS